MKKQKAESPKTSSHSEKVKKPITKIVLEISPDKYFILCDGRPIKDYKELAEMLETIGEDIFQYHVGGDRNDFANWIRDVFNEHELADSIKDVRNKFEMMAKIYKHMMKKSKK
jgi:hypothetical protein